MWFRFSDLKSLKNTYVKSAAFALFNMVLSMEQYAGKVAVVTGASAGIGVRIVKMLVQNGMIVIGLARRVELIQELSEDLKDLTGELHPMQVDITDDDALVKTFQEIELKFKAIHVLINNAGVFPLGRLRDGEVDMWRTTLNTNVIAVCLTSREAIRIMTKTKIDGIIININSITGHKVIDHPFLNIYPGSKHALTGITGTLRKELVDARSRIRVTSISPGGVLTERNEILRISKDKYLALLNPEDVAQCIEFVLSTPTHVQVQELMVSAVGDVD